LTKTKKNERKAERILNTKCVLECYLAWMHERLSSGSIFLWKGITANNISLMSIDLVFVFTEFKIAVLQTRAAQILDSNVVF